MPVYIHWTAPLGFLIFFGFAIRPVAWILFAALILMHEQGHAILGRRAGLHVQSIHLQGNGGECLMAGYPTPRNRAIIAWGGVLGQMPGLLLGLVLSAVFGSNPHPLIAEATTTLVYINAMVMGLNLLPIPGLDGWHAWRLFAPANLRTLMRRSRSRWLRDKAWKIERNLDEIRRRRGMN